jgi:type II secretory pathway pseudopilin PulG
MRLQMKTDRAKSAKQRGYMLLAAMLLVTLMAVGLMLEAQRIAQQIQREKELELIHRGNEYKAAIKKYFRKFGQYPVSLDQLENTNNMRFLRKRYKDPITGKDDWHLWHVGEIQMNLTNGVATGAGQSTGASAIGQSPGSSAFGQSPGGSGFGGSTFGQSSGGGGFGGSTFGQSSGGSAFGGGTFGQSPGGSAFGSSQGPGAGTANSGTSTTGSSTPDQSGSGTTTNPSNGGITAASNMPGASNSPVIGGGPIMGVSSISKKKSIIEIKGKNHYNDWPPFYYDPRQDVSAMMPVTAGTPGGNPAGGFNNGPGINQPGTGMGQSGMGFGPPASGQQGPGATNPGPSTPTSPPN